MVKEWVKAHVRLLILLGLIVILAFGAVVKCKRRLQIPVEEITAPAKAKIDEREIRALQQREAELRLRLSRLEQADRQKREAAIRAADRAVDTAVQGGPDALASYMGRLLTPGDADRMRLDHWAR